jgi:hypothetical protein
MKATAVELPGLQSGQLTFPQTRKKQAIEDGRLQKRILISLVADSEPLVAGYFQAGNLALGKPVPNGALQYSGRFPPSCRS